MAKSTIRSKLTFASMMIGSIVSLILSIGFVYITLPSTLGLVLAIATGIASTYFQGVILYNVLVLQKKEKPLNPPMLTETEVRHNKIKASVFLFVTILSILLTIAASSLGIYQGFLLLGVVLAYPVLITSIVSISCAIIMGLGYLLAGYDQVDVVYQAIKGQNGVMHKSARDAKPLQSQGNTEENNQTSRLDFKEYKNPLSQSKSDKINNENSSIRFFKERPDFLMNGGKPHERYVAPKTRRFSIT